MKRDKRYIKAMLKAIDIARIDVQTKVKTSKTYGLRAIKRFEEANEISFDPFNERHLNKIAGAGHNEELLRKAWFILFG